jgi:hypothetical protein
MKPHAPSRNLVRRALHCARLLAAVGLNGPGQAESLISLADLQSSGYAGAPHGLTEVRLIQPAATAGNIGGYIKLNLRPGWSLLARQLFDGEGIVGSSFKDGPPGMTVLVGDTTGWRVSNQLDGWSEPDLPLQPGTAAFVFNPNTNGLSVTFTGEIRSGTTIIEIPAGRSLVSSVIPQQMVPGPDFGLSLEPGSIVRRWTGEDFIAHPFQPGWGGNPPVVLVGEGFVLDVPNALTWGRTFEVTGGATRAARHAETVAYRISLPPLTNETPQVNLFTWNADPHFGRVFDADGVTPLGDGFVAEVWGAANPTEELQNLAGPFPFRSGPSAGWLREGALNLPDSFRNETAWLQLRVWYRPWHASFEAAQAKQERVGWSPLAEVPLGSLASLKPLSPLNTFPSFALQSRPRIGGYPLESSVTAGTDFVLAPAVVASEPVVWNWTFKPFGSTNETLLSGEDRLFLREVNAADAGTYRLTGTNAFGASTTLATRVRVVPPRPIGELFQPANLDATVGGAAGWFGQVTDFLSGPSASRSGTIGHATESWVETRVEGPGLLAFWWKVSSETNWDTLEAQLDGETRLSISGEVDWERRTLEVPAGAHALRWRYAKDETVSAGLDHGWLDDLSFIPRGVAPAVVTQPSDLEVAEHGVATLSVAAKGFPAPQFQWLHHGKPVAGATNATLTFAPVQRSQSGTYAVQINNAAGEVTSRAVMLSVMVPTPPLRLAQAGDALLISWPTDDDFMLESASRLGTGADWRPASPPPIKLGGQMALPLAPGGPTTFYRLKLR